MEQGCAVPRSKHRGLSGEQQPKCHASCARFAAGSLGNLGEQLGVGAEPGVINNFLVTAWVLQLFSPQILPPP